MAHYPRDLVGYGGKPPDPRWPHGARLAINFVLNLEEGSEYSIPDGDGFSEASLTESPVSSVPHGERDLAAESMFEYGSRVGFWRVLALFTERQIPATAFACALALERNPSMVQAVRDAGLDLCCHGFRWIEHYRLSEEEERKHIRMAVESIEGMFGAPPLGWYCRTGPSVNTRRLLVEHGGFVYDSDAYNDELPYWVTVADQGHLVIPYSLTSNDSKFARGVFATSNDYFAFLKDTLDVLHAEGARRPKMISVGLHMRVVGHPGRAVGLARFLDYVAQLPEVWICRRIDLARHWITTHPYNPEEAFTF